MLVAFLIKSNSSSRVLFIGVPLSGRKAEEGIELISTHIITELGGVDVVIPASAGSGNSVPEGKKATLKADSDELIRFSHAPGGFLHADLLDGRFRNRGGTITHQVIKGNAGGIGKGLDAVRAGGVLPGKILADSGLGSPGLFRQARLYVGEIENRYLTGEVRRKVIYHLYKLPQVTINNEKVLLKDEQVFHIGEIEIRCFHVPGHTWGHMVYLIDGKYLFTGDTIWFGADGGYSFISALAEDNKMAVRSLAELEARLKKLGVKPLFITGHTGWTDNFDFAFAHKDRLCSPFGKRVHDPSAPYDAYDETDDTKEKAQAGRLKGIGR